MKTNIRKAILKDAVSFFDIKNKLPMPYTEGSTSKGGFLLGTDIKTYEKYIQTSHCLIAENNGIAVGFGIMLQDDLVRSSDIWKRRHEADWLTDITPYESKRICYFEQLAFLPEYKRTAIMLAYQLADTVFNLGHEILFTTTVSKPVTNMAAVPFIHAAGGFKAGEIQEYYPVVGDIHSHIYLVEKNIFYANTDSHALASIYLNRQKQFA